MRTESSREATDGAGSWELSLAGRGTQAGAAAEHKEDSRPAWAQSWEPDPCSGWQSGGYP